jgi:hypothetical protein
VDVHIHRVDAVGAASAELFGVGPARVVVFW